LHLDCGKKADTVNKVLYNPYTSKIPFSLSRLTQIHCRLWTVAKSGNIDHILIHDNGDELQCSVCYLHSTGEMHNFKVSTKETKIMAFKGKYLIKTKILLVIIY
jgi:hypothetical protein